MVVFSSAKDSIILVLFNLVEGDESIAAPALNRFSEDSVLIVTAECIHQDVWLSRCHMNAAFALLDFTALDLGVVPFGNLESRSKYARHCHSLNNLLGTLTLQVDAHHLTVHDL